MKKIFSILILALVMGQSINAQQDLDPKGQWFVFLDHNYKVTLNDVVEISKGIPYMDSGLYKLKNGQQFYCSNAMLWSRLMTDILTKVKGSPIKSIADELSTGKIVPWDDNISTHTQNYAITNGKSWVVNADYKGGDNVEALVYMGYPVLKTAKPCLNPQNPKISKGSIAGDIPVGVDSTVVYGGYSAQQPVVVNNYNYITTTGGNATNTNTNTNTNTTPEKSFDGGPMSSSLPVDNGMVYIHKPRPRYREQYYPPQPRFQLRGQVNVSYNRPRPARKQVVTSQHASGTRGFKEGNVPYNASATKGRKS